MKFFKGIQDTVNCDYYYAVSKEKINPGFVWFVKHYCLAFVEEVKFTYNLLSCKFTRHRFELDIYNTDDTMLVYACTEC